MVWAAAGSGRERAEGNSLKKFLLGLTGSIGMGKSTTAQMFRDEGIPVWDADATVHELYAKEGAAVAEIEAILPHVIVDGAVSRPLLKEEIADDLAVLAKLEEIVHPLVADARQDFIDQNEGLLLIDIPLLFEIKADNWLDAVVVVSVAEDIQRERVLARPGMTVANFETIRSRQLSDSEKRARADYVIETTSLDAARSAVAKIVREIKARLNDAPDRT